MIETGDATEQTRIVVLEATSCSQHTLGRPSLLKLSDLTLEGPADSTSVVLDPAGEYLLILVPHRLKHMYRRFQSLPNR